MISLRKLIFSFAAFIAVYLLLLLPQVNMNGIYAEQFCKLGNYLYEDFPHGGYVRLTTQTDKGKNDVSLFLSKASWIENGKLTGVSTNKASDRIGYLITAFFLALVIATPVTWKRKLVALSVGLVLVTAFVMLKLYIIILQAYTQVDWFGLFQEPSAMQSIQFWYENFAAPASYGYSFVVIVWLASCIGGRQWKQLNRILHRENVQRKYA
jgi:hypothetical protein